MSNHLVAQFELPPVSITAATLGMLTVIVSFYDKIFISLPQCWSPVHEYSQIPRILSDAPNMQCFQRHRHDERKTFFAFVVPFENDFLIVLAFVSNQFCVTLFIWSRPSIAD